MDDLIKYVVNNVANSSLKVRKASSEYLKRIYGSFGWNSIQATVRKVLS